MIKLLQKVIEVLVSWGPIGTSIAFVLGLFVSGMTYLNGLWDEVFLLVDNVLIPNFPAVYDFGPLTFANYIVPVDTTLNYCAGLFILKIACVAIRIIKSWIPTVSG